MQHKKTILFSVIAIFAFCFFSCGKDTKGSLSSSQNTETQATVDITNNFSETTNSDEKYNAYIKSELNELANNLFREADYYFTDYETDADIIYGNVRNNDGFGREIVRQSPRVGEIEYIFIFDSNKKVETAIAWTCLDDKKYVGCGGKMDSIEEINAHNWDEVLSYYGFKEGEYTKYANINNTTEAPDEDSQGKKSSSRTMASGIGMEFFCNESPLPDMVYGHIRDNSEFGNYFFSIHKSLDEDVEYIAFVNNEGFAEDVLCWICSYEKKYVGIAKKYDSNLKDDFENWDEVLAYFGLKEGEYTNIYSEKSKT